MQPSYYYTKPGPPAKWNMAVKLKMTHSRLKSIYCVGCGKPVEARLISGEEAYPHRKDLYALPFWKCDCCGNFVGCHHKTSNPTRPLGVIPTPGLKRERRKLHELIDPIWKTRKASRKRIYAHISNAIGRQYHTADIKSVDEAKNIYSIVLDFKRKLGESK